MFPSEKAKLKLRFSNILLFKLFNSILKFPLKFEWTLFSNLLRLKNITCKMLSNFKFAKEISKSKKNGFKFTLPNKFILFLRLLFCWIVLSKNSTTFLSNL